MTRSGEQPALLSLRRTLPQLATTVALWLALLALGALACTVVAEAWAAIRG